MSHIASSESHKDHPINKFPPVVAVLGHVDHGKTTLLDAIRKTSIAPREVGGITQKIGASSVEIDHENRKRAITFIDTPGHEAFSEMRSRGARVADLALLIVASNEGLKPQTRESIDILKKTNTLFIVVLTKSDLPTKNSEKVKQELLKEQIQLEEFGGDVPLIEVSSKTNNNIKQLLDLILLVYDLHSPSNAQDLIPDPKRLEAIVVESRLDPRVGARATVVLKNGQLLTREEVHTEGINGKIRTIIDDKGKHLKEANIGDAVEILGLEKVPAVGSIIQSKSLDLTISEPRQPAIALKKDLVYLKKEDKVSISVILVADTQGSLEAIINALPDNINIVSKKTGEVSEADVLMAKSTGSIIISFNTKVRPNIEKLASTEKILLRNYSIIYVMLDELKDAIEGKLQSQMEKIFGQASVLAKFPFEKTWAFGIKVEDGRIARGDKIRIMRGDTEIGETSISSLRVGKNPTSKVEKNHEAGILIGSTIDIQVGDMILSHS